MQDKNTNRKKYAVVTGSSSGIGFETSILLARNGFHTYATMRNTERAQPLLDVVKKDNLPIQVLPLDVTNGAAVKETIERIVNETRKIDVLVNNAGS